jgi:acetyltransferase-like isoleucine patch superfamily enzyme
MKKLILKIILSPIHLNSFLRKKIRLFILNQKGASIGEGTYISPKAYIDIHPPGKVTIGNNCFIARNAMILCHTSVTKGGPKGVWAHYGGRMEFSNVVIGKNVLVGANAVILPGVTIGNNVIIGSNCVVHKDILSGLVVGGVPYKVIMKTKDLLKNKCDNFNEADWENNFAD